MKHLWLKIAVLVSYLSMIAVNFLSNYLPLNGLTAGQVSDSYPNLFAPAGITFSIWGLIYILLAFYIFFQFQKNDKFYRHLNLYFIISSVANIAWIFSWHYNFIFFSLIWIVILLLSLIKIADLIRKEKFKNYEKPAVVWPFSAYFAWIMVATIANVTVLLVSFNWNGFGLSPQLWTIIALLLGAGIGIWRAIHDRNSVYPIVFIWAYFGILYKHLSLDYFAGEYIGIITTVTICIFLFLVSLFFSKEKLKINK